MKTTNIYAPIIGLAVLIGAMIVLFVMTMK